MKHLKLFETSAQYESFKSSSDFVLPNVSYIKELLKVGYHLADSEPSISNPNLVCTYNITNTTRETTICKDITNFSSMIVDGVEVPIAKKYLFDTEGEHTVEFVMIDNTILGDSVFSSCKIISVIIPDSVKTIETQAFGRNDLQSIIIPASVVSIGSNAFSNINGLLQTINVDPSNTAYYSLEKHDCLVEKATNTAILATKTFDIADLPSSVTGIGDTLFANRTDMTSLVIPDNIETIGVGAFRYCTSLTSITIGQSVKTIESQAFEGCKYVTEIICYATTAPELMSDDVFDLSTEGVLRYPDGSDYSSWISQLPDGWTAVSISE